MNSDNFGLSTSIRIRHPSCNKGLTLNMQVTKSSQHCSSSFEPEARGGDTSAGTTVNSLQASEIPGASRPRNPSWLSNYKIIVQKETEPVLSVINPGESSIERTRPAPISGEPIRSESSVAGTSFFQKERQSEETQETAITISMSEETNLVLSIVGRSDFKIEKNRPAAISGEFFHQLERDIDKISILYKADSFAEAKEKAILVVNTLSDKPEAENFVRYLNTVIFLCHIMQDITFFLYLPANNSEDFINWLLDIANAASQETDDLPASSRLMLFCWRWAADAGDQSARLCLVKVLLFRQLCHDMPLPNVHFFPVEASRYLADMAQDDTPLPIPTNDQESAINKMVELIRSRNTADFVRKKEKLTDLFRKESRHEIQLLIPFICTNDAFGSPEYDKANKFLKRFRNPCKGKQTGSSIDDVHQFWRLRAGIPVCGSPAGDVVEALDQLARRGFLAAIHLLGKLSLTHEDILHKYIASFIRSSKPHFLDYPSLVYSFLAYNLGQARVHIKATNSQGVNSTGHKVLLDVEMVHNAIQMCDNLMIQADPEMRDLFLYRELSAIFREGNLQQINKASAPLLPEPVARVLIASRYTQDPAALVYLHCVQVLQHGEGDEKLIETAEQKNALSTYVHMLMMSDATTTMDNVVQVNRLLDIPGIQVQDFLKWKNHPGMPALLGQLRACEVLCRKPVQCSLLCIDLCGVMDLQKKETGRHLVVLAREKILQDDLAGARKYCAQAQSLEDSSQRSMGLYEVPTDYQTRRPGLPEYYQQLLSAGTKSEHPLEVRCRFNLLMSVWEKMRENKDPSLWLAWAVKAFSFIRYSHYHVSPEMCQKIITCCNSAIEKQYALSIELGSAALNRLMIIGRGVSNKRTSERIAFLIFQAAGNIDEMARLPDFRPNYRACIEQHHIVAKVQTAKSTDDVIKYLKSLAPEHTFDPPTLIRLLIPWFESAIPESYDKDCQAMLSILHRKLDRQISLFEDTKINLECQLMWAVHIYCHEFVGNFNKTMNDIAMTMERQKTALFIKFPEYVVRCKDDKITEESSLFFWVDTLNAFKNESAEEFKSLLMAVGKSCHPRVVLRLFCNDIITKRQCVSRLEQLQTENKYLKRLCKFLICQINNQSKEMKSFIRENMRKATLDNAEKTMWLWYAYESTLITADVLNKQMACLPRDSSHYLFIKLLLGDGCVNRLMNLTLFPRIMLLDRHYQDAVGFKLFSLGRLDDAADMWSAKYQSAYPLAMLAWHHDIQPRTQSVDIEQQLLAAAKDAQVKAQCELIHWLMKRQKEGEEINDRQVAVACRFVHTPNPMAGGESILYQGITQYIGFGCDVDLKAGMEKIQEALNEDPLAVSLRLYDLKEQGLFVLPDDPPTDYLLRYAQALSERDHDPFNRRDNYPANLLLSYGRNKLQKLLASLRDGASSPSAHPAYQKAADRLDSWLDQWQKGAALPASASPEMPEAAALPASAPQETPRATVSSTRASRKKSGAPASSASASRKKSRATASSRKAPAKPLEVTACTKKDVEQVLNRATGDNWQTATLCEMDELTRKLRSGSKTGLDVEIQEELYNLLDAMPLTSRELAEHADTIVDHISRSGLITGIVTNWMMKLYFGSDPEKAFLTERIVKALPAALPLSMAVENKDDIGNEEEPENKEDIENKENVVNKENVMRFLGLLIQYQPMPEAVRYLWDALSAEDRAHLLLQGLPDGIDKNPVMYQQHVETVQSPDPVLVDGIWRALNPASDARLIQATLAALITQNSSELQVIKADDGRLKGIDLYTLFAGCNTAQRKTLLECHSILDGGLIKSYIEKHRRNPGKSVPLKHLPGTIENALDNERKKSTKERDLLDLLIQAQDNSSSIRPDLLQAFSSKAKAMAVETMKKSIDSSEQQDARLTALAISFLVS